MRVLAIDPGYERLGIAVLEGNPGSETLLYSGCTETDRSLTFPERLAELGAHLKTLIVEYEPQALAIETLFFNKNQKTAMSVAQARGAILYVAKAHGLDIYEFGPQEVKVAITGYGKSDKKAVIDMVKRLVSEAPEHGLDDEYDAIAVGVTCIAHYRE